MILSTLRIMQTNHFKTPLICSDTDFQTALEIVKILVQHAATVFSALSAEKETPTNQQSPNDIVSSIAATVRQANLHYTCYATANPRKYRQQVAYEICKQ